MKTLKTFRVASLLLALCLALPAIAESPKPQNPFEAVREFSATMNGGLIGTSSDGKVYRSGDLMRVDLATEYMVTDLATNATFAVLYSTGLCLEGSVPAGRTYPFSLARGAKIDLVGRGEETVDNHPAKVKEVTITQEGRFEVKLTIWEAKDLQGFPIKMRRAATKVVGSKEREVLYTDVHIGPPDPALFLKPKDCGAAPRAPGSHIPGPQPPAPTTPAKSSTSQN
ncbi:MAG TPA: hypothetical protein VK828_14755 [Terriglobales bacterium]|jgi:hypothetical protein|nr:hypothetical protein [Terriglobales bacterium]